MNSLKIFLFFILIENIYLLPDYCTSRTSPTQPNDCFFLSNDRNKCCFNPNNNETCVWESPKEEGLLCDINYFYKYMIGEEYYKNYRNKKGYCTFIYGNMRGAFQYEKSIEASLNIKEFNGLIIDCLSNQDDIIKMNLLSFFFVLIFIF